jgi:hypothetical protein
MGSIENIGLTNPSLLPTWHMREVVYSLVGLQAVRGTVLAKEILPKTKMLNERSESKM